MLSESLYRVVDDFGPVARIRARFTDADGNPITDGAATMVAWDALGTLFARPATHTVDGWWHIDPQPNDLDRSGTYNLELQGADVTVPAREAATLVVRERGSVG